MLHQLAEEDRGAFRTACAFEHVFGSKALTALQIYGLADSAARFFLCRNEVQPTAALYLSGGVLTIAAEDTVDVKEIAALAKQENVNEVNTNFTLCAQLQQMLGGTMESSCSMVYEGPPVTDAFPDIKAGEMPAVFDILQRSHPYYRAHFTYETWSADTARKLQAGICEIYQLERDGTVIGTGSIATQDDTCAILSAIAVPPEYRHRGLGSHITRFLTQRILQMGKTPRLIAGYDAVSALYAGLGFATCGRWGELHL